MQVTNIGTVSLFDAGVHVYRFEHQGRCVAVRLALGSQRVDISPDEGDVWHAAQFTMSADGRRFALVDDVLVLYSYHLGIAEVCLVKSAAVPEMTSGLSPAEKRKDRRLLLCDN